MALTSMRTVRAMYRRYVKLYYSSFEMPHVEDVTFEWISVPGVWGQSHPDRDQPVVRLDRELRKIPRLLSMILLHELSHIAHPRADHGPKWKEEAIRLGTLGAMKEFF